MPFKLLNARMASSSGGHKLMIRPSGTEPKIKVYLSAVGESEAAADAVNAALSKAAAEIMKV